MRTSESLSLGEVYTRAELREAFEIRAASINNGIFCPQGHDSIWLFVTKDKTSDRTQYIDELKEDHLYFDGQSAGLTDRMLIEHETRGLEVIVFYRESKAEHRASGFRYEGRFAYVGHHGTRPAHFHFVRIEFNPRIPV